MNPKRRDSACERRSPDVYSSSSAASSTKNTNTTSQYQHASAAASGSVPSSGPGGSGGAGGAGGSNSGAGPGGAGCSRPPLNLQDCLLEMNSVMRVLDNAQLDPQSRLEELNSVLSGNLTGDDEVHGAVTPLASPSNGVGPGGPGTLAGSLSSNGVSPEVEALLRNQQALLRQIADSRSQLSALEQQYQQVNRTSGVRAVLSKVRLGGTREVNAALRVSQDANALVERLRAQVQETAEEYGMAQDTLDGIRLSQRATAGAPAAEGGVQIDAYGAVMDEEDVFERADPDGDAPVSDDNKIGSIQCSNSRFARRLVPHGAPMSAPYYSAMTSFEFPDTTGQSEFEDKVRKLNETKLQIDALRGMISKLENRGGPLPSRATPRPVPLYPAPPPPPPQPPLLLAAAGPTQSNVSQTQQRRRQQLHEINRSLQNIETLIQREVAQQDDGGYAQMVHLGTSIGGLTGHASPVMTLPPHMQASLHMKRNLSVGCGDAQNNHTNNILANSSSNIHNNSGGGSSSNNNNNNNNNANSSSNNNNNNSNNHTSNNQHHAANNSHHHPFNTNSNNTIRTGVRPRFNSCNNIQPVHHNHPHHHPQQPQQQQQLHQQQQQQQQHQHQPSWAQEPNTPYNGGGYNNSNNNNNNNCNNHNKPLPLLSSSSSLLFADGVAAHLATYNHHQRGSQPRSLTEAATWGGSSTQDNSDNGEAASDDCTDSEMERLATGSVGAGDGAGPVVHHLLVDELCAPDTIPPAAIAAGFADGDHRSSCGGGVRRPKSGPRADSAASAVAVAHCSHCSHLAAYTQMLTLSLVQANEVINGQQKELERLRAALARASAAEVVTTRLSAAAAAAPTTTAAAAAPTAGVATSAGIGPLNNQVTPGLRANNYVDNLKSLSTLNLFNHSSGSVGLSAASAAAAAAAAANAAAAGVVSPAAAVAMGPVVVTSGGGPSSSAEQRNDLSRGGDDDHRRQRRPNKNSMNSMSNQVVNFCSSSNGLVGHNSGGGGGGSSSSRYSSNPELNNNHGVDSQLAGATGATAAAVAAAANMNAGGSGMGASAAGGGGGGKVALAQLSRERLEMQPALDAATAFLATRAGELCTPDVLIQTCRCLLDQLTPAGVSHKHILRVLQPTLGQFLARPVEPGQIMETLTGVLQNELAQLAKSGATSPPERAFGAGVSGISDRSTAGNEQTEDAEGASGGDIEGGEEMAEADRGADDVPPEIGPLAVGAQPQVERDDHQPTSAAAPVTSANSAGATIAPGQAGSACPSLDHVPTRDGAQVPSSSGAAVGGGGGVGTVSSSSEAAGDETVISSSHDANPDKEEEQDN